MSNSVKVENSSEQQDTAQDEKDLEAEEKVLKTLSSAANIEDKFKLLLKKYVQNEKKLKKSIWTMKQQEKLYYALLKEKELLQKDYQKEIQMRSKLEQVCREQQKMIKVVENESITKIKEEEAKRKENQAKFQESINKINVTLNKNSEENIKLRTDNLEMAKKLKYLSEQYQLREKQVKEINEQIQLESQLHDAKLEKLKMEYTIEKEILLREKKGAMEEVINYKKLVEEMQRRENFFKEQVDVYTSKYSEFQNSLQKSNGIFATYKTELEKMSKNTKKVEKECLEWKKKWEKCNGSVITLINEKEEKTEYINKLLRQMTQLQKLLRVLQAERNSLHEILKEHNIERPPVPTLPEENELLKSSTTVAQEVKSEKLDQMVKNCAELKQTLAQLQNQVKEISNQPTKPTDKPTSSINSNKKENTDGKSNKSKKNKNKNKSHTNENNLNTEQKNIEITNLKSKNNENLNIEIEKNPNIEEKNEKIDEIVEQNQKTVEKNQETIEKNQHTIENNQEIIMKNVEIVDKNEKTAENIVDPENDLPEMNLNENCKTATMDDLHCDSPPILTNETTLLDNKNKIDIVDQVSNNETQNPIDSVKTDLPPIENEQLN